MVLRLLYLLSTISFCVSLYAQTGSAVQSNAVTTVSINGTSVLRPVAGANIYVCAATATSCNAGNQVPAYSDYNLGGLITQPVKADTYGNFFFYTPAGQFKYTIYSTAGTALGTYPFTAASANGNTAYVDATRPGVWQRMGTVLRGNAGTEWAVQEASIIHENNAKILGEPGGDVADFLVFKMWYVCGWINEGLCYAESYDGATWVNYATPIIAPPANVAHMVVRKFGSTYVMYAANSPTNATAINRWTSTDGLTWTMVNTNVITQGVPGSWDDGPIGGMDIAQQPDGSYVAVYEASSVAYNVYQSGVATSPDGIHFTKYSGNPTIKGNNNGPAGGPDIHQIGGLWYMWGQCGNQPTSEPTDMCRWHTSTFLSQWTNDGIVLRRRTRDEGPDRNDALGGQVGGTRLVEVSGADGKISTYMWYVATRTQDTPTASNDGSHVKMAIANMSLAQVVQTPEGDTTPTNAWLDYSQPSFYRRDYQGTPWEDDFGEFASGNITLNGGTDSRICLNAYHDANTNTDKYISSGPAICLRSPLGSLNGRISFFAPGTAYTNLAPETDVLDFNATGVYFNSRINNYYGLQKATGTGCTPSGAGTACNVTMTIPVPYISGGSGYTVVGCALSGGNSGTVLGRTTSGTLSSFTVEEIAVSAGAGGGNVTCLVMAN